MPFSLSLSSCLSRLRILSFLCTAALLNILHLIALEQRSRVEQFSGPICMANISQCSSSRQNGLEICICHGSFPIFCPSPPTPLLSLSLSRCASIAFVGIWRRFIDCAVDSSSVVFGRKIFVYICPPACQAAWAAAASTDATRFDSLCVSFYVLFLEHFQQNTLRFSFLQQLRCAFKWHLKYLSWVLAHNFINAARACSAASCLLLAASACCLCIHISHVYLWH